MEIIIVLAVLVGIVYFASKMLGKKELVVEEVFAEAPYKVEAPQGVQGTTVAPVAKPAAPKKPATKAQVKPATKAQVKPAVPKKPVAKKAPVKKPVAKKTATKKTGV